MRKELNEVREEALMTYQKSAPGRRKYQGQVPGVETFSLCSGRPLDSNSDWNPSGMMPLKSLTLILGTNGEKLEAFQQSSDQDGEVCFKKPFQLPC